MIADSQTIGSLLASLSDLQAISVRLHRVAVLQQIYLRAVPRELANRSRVADEHAGTVVIAADTSAVAAKLRQLAPRIAAEIVKHEPVPERTSIRLEVQLTPSNAPGRRAGPRISQAGVRSLTQLRDSLPDSPLRQAVTQLLGRHQPSDREDQSFQSQEGEHD